MSKIQDVANLAGVSVATVSRVLNNSPKVSAKTRLNVINAVKELNYEPNLLGRNLRRSETKMILVLLQNISNPFYSKVIKGMEDYGHKNNYNVMFCNTDSNIEREKKYLDLLKNKLVDGVIFMAPEIDIYTMNTIGKNYPLIQCCEYLENSQISRVSIDNEKAAFEAVEYLIKNGHKKIGLINSKKPHQSSKDREKGYRRALYENNIQIDESLIRYESYGFKGGINAIKSFVDEKKVPDALFTVSDIIAIGAIKALKSFNFNVPDDISIIGFDNLSISSMYDPILSTVSQPRYELGNKAMELIIEIIKNKKNIIKNVVLNHQLLIRESTKKE
ncbi:LacI family transcriptional regulator [Oceanotoga teriensis]|uniref:LacI family transcriptional regulator n=1 Tax=Oceanotoga teriensis TaxID=515440 RepID=A0AA45C8I0_9BACT|nr:LacI family DNA-binding transcriptional regulator [Oceanotoga teriensis]PWJ95993.1 LacI family transcriptional regulator [Oceanotoga teriensis]